MRIPKSLVAMLPNGTEHYEEITPSGFRGFTSHDYQRVCENAVRAAGLTTPRLCPATVQVSLFSLEIAGGKLIRRAMGQFPTMPTCTRMTDVEYAAEMRETLATIPESFRSYVESKSYEDGHSSGYEEVIGIARCMVADLAPCIADYATSLKKKRS